MCNHYVIIIKFKLYDRCDHDHKRTYKILYYFDNEVTIYDI